MRAMVAYLALLTVAAPPAEAGAGQSLSLRDAVALARKHNLTILAAQGDAQAAQAAAKGARALANPEIVLAPTVVGEGGSDEAVVVAQPLEMSGQRSARARVAAGEADAARADAAVVEREVIRDVKQAYWGAALAQAVADLSRANEEHARALHAAAVRQVEVGAVPGADAMKAEVEKGRIMQERLAAETELAKARASLNTLLSRPLETPFELSEELQFSPLGMDEELLLRTALTNRPEIIEARALLSARRAEIDEAAALRRPDLAVQFRRESFDKEAGVGVSFILRFIDWGSAREEQRRARAAAEAQEWRLSAVENEVRLQVASALRDVRRAEGLVRLYEQGLLAQSEQLAQMAQKGYAAGATGYLEVLEAQRTLRGVRSGYYATLAAHLQATAQLEWATGCDLTEVQGVKR